MKPKVIWSGPTKLDYVLGIKGHRNVECKRCLCNANCDTYCNTVCSDCFGEFVIKCDTFAKSEAEEKEF